jgi:hypothetical protein
MTLRSGIYIVPTDRWYIERTVWLIAGGVLIAATALAALVDPRWVLLVIATGVASIGVSLTGFCIVGTVLRFFGFAPMLGTPGAPPGGVYLMQTDKWYLERRIYLAVGINISVASVLSLVHSPWWLSFTAFVGVAMVWFAATGFCIIGVQPRRPHPPRAGASERARQPGSGRSQRADTVVHPPDLGVLQLDETARRWRHDVLQRGVVGGRRGHLAALGLREYAGLVVLGERILERHPAAMQRARHGAAAGGVTAQPLRVGQQIGGKPLSLVGGFEKRRPNDRVGHMIGSEAEPALAIPARLDQVVQQAPFRLLGHDAHLSVNR